MNTKHILCGLAGACLVGTAKAQPVDWNARGRETAAIMAQKHRSDPVFAPYEVIQTCAVWRIKDVLCDAARREEQKRADKYHDEPCWMMNKC